MSAQGKLRIVRPASPASEEGCCALDLSKIEPRVAALGGSEQQGYVIVSSGSFAPPHRMHVEMLERARAALEQFRGSDASGRQRPGRVVGGVLAPSSDAYVGRKLGADAIPLADRVRMCAAACADSSWIVPCGWGVARGSEIVRRVEAILRARFPGKRLAAVEVHGADTILRFKAWQRACMFVVVGREGASERLRAELSRCQKDVHRRSQLVFDEGLPLPDVSSTQIRALVRAAAAAATTEHSSPPEALLQLLHPAVADYMVRVVLKTCWAQR